MLKNKYPLVILLLLAVLWVVTENSILVLNLTPSMPRGLYVKEFSSEINRSDIVLVCLNDPYKNLGLAKGYLVKGKKCQGSDPLLKSVIAIPGDNVVLYDDYVMVNGVKLPYPTLSFDSKNRPLTPYPRKTYLNTSGYWLIGTHDKRSWDSRYWGPVARQQIISKIKSLIFWLSFQKSHC